MSLTRTHTHAQTHTQRLTQLPRHLLLAHLLSGTLQAETLRASRASIEAERNDLLAQVRPLSCTLRQTGISSRTDFFWSLSSSSLSALDVVEIKRLLVGLVLLSMLFRALSVGSLCSFACSLPSSSFCLPYPSPSLTPRTYVQPSFPL